MRKALPVTPAEFEILEILWDEPGAVPVSRVLKILQQHKRVAYTTVMTLLDTMARKGSVRRKKQGKAYLYRPSASRETVLGQVVDDFARRYFGGTQKLGSFMTTGDWSNADVSEPERSGEEMDVVLL